MWLLSYSHYVQVGSKDIDSGNGSQSDEDQGSDSEDGSVGPSGKQDGVEGSEEDNDEVGDLSWEAVMAAVQGGGSDDDGEDEVEAVAAAGHSGHADAEPIALPKKAVQGKPRQSFHAAPDGKHGKAVNKQSPKLGKRSRQT